MPVENALMIIDENYLQPTESKPTIEGKSAVDSAELKTNVENFADLHKHLPKLHQIGEPIGSRYVMDVNNANVLITLIYESRVSRNLVIESLI